MKKIDENMDEVEQYDIHMQEESPGNQDQADYKTNTSESKKEKQ